MPKIESTAMSAEYGRFVIGPLERGYGTTLGLSLIHISEPTRPY